MSRAKRRKKSVGGRGAGRGRTIAGRSVPSRARRRRAPHEDRAAEVLTVMWMLTAVATLAAQVVAAAAWVVQLYTTVPDDPGTVRIVPTWFLFCAAVTGLVCLTVTPLVYVLRRRPPPAPVTWATVVICLLPWIVVAGRLAR
jgi:hypothetical protein